jgi:hypothetical protein
MKWRFKELKKLLKETVSMTPNNGQANGQMKWSN